MFACISCFDEFAARIAISLRCIITCCQHDEVEWESCSKLETDVCDVSGAWTCLNHSHYFWCHGINSMRMLVHVYAYFRDCQLGWAGTASGSLDASFCTNQRAQACKIGVWAARICQSHFQAFKHWSHCLAILIVTIEPQQDLPPLSYPYHPPSLPPDSWLLTPHHPQHPPSFFIVIIIMIIISFDLAVVLVLSVASTLAYMKWLLCTLAFMSPLYSVASFLPSK